MMRSRTNIVGLCSKKYKLLGFFVLIAFLGVLFWHRWANQSVNPQSNTISTFVVKKGEGLSSIASRLQKEGLIRNALIFRLAVIRQKQDSQIQAGSFRLSPSLAVNQIISLLTHGTSDVWLTFPEGWRKEEFSQRLFANLENFDVSSFLQLTKALEGELFPDTYLIPKKATPSMVVKILTDNYKKKTQDLQISRSELILASIVEREVKQDDDRQIVAGILKKRWQKNWPLQADATVQYAVADNKDWWPELTKNDLKIDSPYNTYKYKGLPPAPICNPGLSSIKAVLNSQETAYWYYLSDSEGKIHYSQTIDEHNQNIAKYLK